jgi:hypothetical protein
VVSIGGTGVFSLCAVVSVFEVGFSRISWVGKSVAITNWKGIPSYLKAKPIEKGGESLNCIEKEREKTN